MNYYAVIDTNVLVSALLKSASIPGIVARESLEGSAKRKRRLFGHREHQAFSCQAFCGDTERNAGDLRNERGLT